MRASRLVSLVLLLQVRGAMTAAELARELEVSERTVARDVSALSEAGIPVYAERGRAGGYRLIDGYRTRLTGMSRAEAEALFLSGLPGPAEDMGLADAVATARLKVLAALPPSLQDAPARTGQRFHLDVAGWFDDGVPPPRLAALARAVWQDETVVLTYRRRDREVTRTAEPYGLVLKSGTWYLVARVEDGHRTYRVDRVEGVEATGEAFERDAAFDLRAFWNERAERFVESLLTDAVTVRLSPAGRRMLRYAVEPPAARRALEGAGEPDGRGWVVTRLPVESVDVAYTQLMWLGPEAEVLEPPELRVRMAEAATRFARLYQR
ncbi:helix-turn-helix transcriptional regulator [Thermomonospora umbrina]|uniref:Putative DNA-binding transcriptional regulator YafY n=1 Tax=Thermomonospora umbrina TaxID=111806 RepID=A0A3D9SSD3_9ACTN|nr:WYL domain-containing protein [Thermomonospora umbrina]REE98879.1 putative DNA-binding transcriptional regulator YafY [Thermomonospora umbrina]